MAEAPRSPKTTKRHCEERRYETIVFVDCPDPDNFVLVVAANLLRGCTRVVLTGRPANFGVASRPVYKSNCRAAPGSIMTLKPSTRPARWRGRKGLSPLDAVSTVAFSPRKGLSEGLSGTRLTG